MLRYLTLLLLLIFASPHAFASLVSLRADFKALRSIDDETENFDQKLTHLQEKLLKDAREALLDPSEKAKMTDFDYKKLLDAIQKRFSNTKHNEVYHEKIAAPLVTLLKQTQGIDKDSAVVEMLSLVRDVYTKQARTQLQRLRYLEFRPALMQAIANSSLNNPNIRNAIIAALAKMYIDTDHTYNGARLEHYFGDTVLFAIVKLASQNDSLEFASFNTELIHQRVFGESVELNFGALYIPKPLPVMKSITDFRTLMGLLASLKNVTDISALNQLLSIVDYAIYEDAKVEEIFYARTYDMEGTGPHSLRRKRPWRTEPHLALPQTLKLDLMKLLETENEDERLAVASRIGRELCAGFFLN